MHFGALLRKDSVDARLYRAFLFCEWDNFPDKGR